MSAKPAPPPPTIAEFGQAWWKVSDTVWLLVHESTTIGRGYSGEVVRLLGGTSPLDGTTSLIRGIGWSATREDAIRYGLRIASEAVPLRREVRCDRCGSVFETSALAGERVACRWGLCNGVAV